MVQLLSQITKKTRVGLYFKKTVLYYQPISSYNAAYIFRGSSMVEHATVNRRVVGSSPSRGAKKRKTLYHKVDFLFFISSSQDMIIPAVLPYKLCGELTLIRHSYSCIMMKSARTL